ncbi:MAG: ATP-binding protein, partial [Frankiaceae bacterium]|nr:ATP-binding protein [Frankiaceae bacterium]
MALVELLLTPLPAHVRTARLVGVAAARRAGLDDAFVDELRLALGEACSRAVGRPARPAPPARVKVPNSGDPGGG